VTLAGVHDSDRSARWPWALVLGYAALVFAVSSIPARAMPGGRLWDFDKVIHAGEYGLFAVLLWTALGRSVAWRGSTRALAVVVLATLYGVSDELHQALVPGRSSSGYDVIADGVGALLVAVMAWWWTRRRQRRVG